MATLDLACKGLYSGSTLALAARGYMETAITVVAPLTLPVAIDKSLGVTATIPYDFRQLNITVNSTLVIAIDYRAPIVGGLTLLLDTLSPLQRDTSLPFDIMLPLLVSGTTPFDTLRPVTRTALIPVESLGNWGVTAFVHSSGAVHFLSPPLRPGPVNTALRQPSGRDTTGGLYVYTKSTNKTLTHTLEFIVDRTTLDQLIAFHCSGVMGKKLAFAWYDQQSQPHSVHFAAGKLPWQRLGPNRYKVTTQLREDSAL